MATDNLTAIPPPENESDGFDALDDRFMSLMSRFQVIKDSLGDFEKVPKELHPAAFVLRETTDDMVRFYGELQDWHMNHEHTAIVRKAVQS